MLFALRGVEPAEMVADAVDLAPTRRTTGRGRLLAADDLSSVFGVDIEMGDAETEQAPRPAHRRRGTGAKKNSGKKVSSEERSKKKASRKKTATRPRVAKRAAKKKATKEEGGNRAAVRKKTTASKSTTTAATKPVSKKRSPKARSTS
jgi:hypothetical protein